MAERDKVLNLLCQRVLDTRAQVGEAWPYHADPRTGQWQTTDDGDWCDGHWIEMLRMAGDLLGRRDLIDEALARTERQRYKLERDDMFRGHRFYYSAARLWETERDHDLHTLALAAAYAVRSMALKVNGAMPIGTEVQVKSASEQLKSRRHVCVDNVHPNLILDWWAWKETGDDTFRLGATRMHDVLERHFIREDGSTIEFIEFDPQTGAALQEFTLLGYSDDSCWSRGQAWAIGGCLMAYEHTEEERFLATATRLFDYWWSQCGAEVPPYDFKDPRPDVPIDTSAAAIVTAALARLVCHRPGAAPHLVGRLEPMLEALCAHVTPTHAGDQRPPGMLVDGCFNHPRRFADDNELLWGDFYLMETLYCLEKGGLPC